MSMFEFEELLLKYGLVQFGCFADENGDFVPFKLNLDWMISYSDVLRAAAFDVQDHFRVHSESIKQFERILCPMDTLPVATLVSSATGIPIVYSRGRGESAVRDLVGAYDINHPTLLLTNSNATEVSLGNLSRMAFNVGLKVKYELMLVESWKYDTDEWYSDSYRGGMVTGVYTLADMAFNKNIITERQKKNVHGWFTNRPKVVGEK